MSEINDIVGQLFCIGFDGQVIDSRLDSMIKEMKPGGIILFRRNIGSAKQLTDLCNQLHCLYEPPPLIGIDQEGGRVHRLSAILPEIPSASSLGTCGKDALVEEIGLIIGQSLRALGIDVDFAPVLDLSSPDAPNGIGDRAFGEDPEVVITMGAAFLRGLLGEGVAGTLKHFPGLGSSEIDSHDSLPIIGKSKTYLSMQDIKPFMALSEISPLIMVGHGYYPSLVTERVPATLSPEIVSDILKKQMKFEGMIITDDMEMGAVKNYHSEGDEAVRALAAGCDMIMYSSSLEMAHRAFDKIAHAVEHGHVPVSRINDSLQKIAEVKRNFVIREKAENVETVVRYASERIIEINKKVLPS